MLWYKALEYNEHERTKPDHVTKGNDMATAKKQMNHSVMFYDGHLCVTGSAESKSNRAQKCSSSSSS